MLDTHWLLTTKWKAFSHTITNFLSCVFLKKNHMQGYYLGEGGFWFPPPHFENLSRFWGSSQLFKILRNIPAHVSISLFLSTFILESPSGRGNLSYQKKYCQYFLLGVCEFCLICFLVSTGNNKHVCEVIFSFKFFLRWLNIRSKVACDRLIVETLG